MNLRKILRKRKGEKEKRRMSNEKIIRMKEIAAEIIAQRDDEKILELIERLNEAKNEKEPELFSCQICDEESKQETYEKCKECDYMMCRVCLERYIFEKKGIECPNCENSLDECEIILGRTKMFFSKYLDMVTDGRLQIERGRLRDTLPYVDKMKEIEKIDRQIVKIDRFRSLKRREKEKKKDEILTEYKRQYEEKTGKITGKSQCYICSCVGCCVVDCYTAVWCCGKKYCQSCLDRPERTCRVCNISLRNKKNIAKKIASTDSIKTLIREHIEILKDIDRLNMQLDWAIAARRKICNKKIDDTKTDVWFCPAESCGGLVKDGKCGKECGTCGVKVCADCNCVKETSHVCREEDLRSLQKIKSDSKKCPQCNVMIYRSEGCPQMWCTHCNIAFDWDTLKIQKGRVHNPHYFEYLRENGGNENEEEEHKEEKTCFECVLSNYLNWNNDLIDAFEEMYTNIQEMYAYYMQRVFREPDERAFVEWRIKYISNEMDEKEWKERIKAFLKRSIGNRLTCHILGKIVNAFDLLVDKGADLSFTEIEDMVNKSSLDVQANEELSMVKKILSVKVPRVTKTLKVTNVPDVVSVDLISPMLNELIPIDEDDDYEDDDEE